MEFLLGLAVILPAAGAVILWFRLWCYKRQIRHMIQQLLFLETEESNFLLTSVCAVDNTSELIRHINYVLGQLRQEQRRLRKVNQNYRESITSISHDIRTPLTSVKGYVQMLLQSEVSEEKKVEYTRIVERRLEELQHILDQLFEYARIEAGELPLNPERINVGNLFTEIISMFYEDFSAKGWEPEIRISREALFIQVDRHAFSRILENLMKNALVHGNGNYRFSMESKEGNARICIANETEEIENKELERIFERFYTTDQSRSRRTTGLGLAIAKELTEQMGGKIQAYFGEGFFTVEVCFPLLKDGVQDRYGL
ncbi:MAG: HAMP domain-containing histidine kinase [Lachnospiraceae bacterium]|jgi:signal transduction histidine kinase|nr:HAMP domain-containing histidine kinase [Lachnospiraceae bacterium]